MSLISDIFQQNQYFTQNPTAAVRTPRQQAYDELLNKQYDIQQENQKYNTYNNLASGLGGLGKVLASAFVKNPIEKAAAANGISEQETRTDGLRQAYEQARTNQNKDYVTQAQQQLALARDDEDKAYNRAYQEAKDRLAQQNADRNYGLEVDKFGFAQDRALENLGLDRDKFGLQKNLTDAKIKKLGAETDNLLNPKSLDNKEEQKNITDMQKSVSELQAQLNSFDKEIPELEQLNKESHLGAVGRTTAVVGGGLGNLFGVKDNSFIEPELKNQEKVARLRQKALGMLKTTFGGAISEGERDAIFAQFGLNKDNMNYKQYENAIKLMRAYFQNKLNEKQETLDLYTNQNSVNWE